VPAARRHGVLLWSALAIVYVVWGSTYLGIAVAIETIPPLLMSAVRFLLAGAVLYAIASRVGASSAADDPIGRRQWVAALITGVPLLVLGNGGLVIAEEWVDTGIASLLIATVPLWMAAIDRIVFGRRLSGRALAGLGIGFGGIALLVGPGGGGGLDALGTTLLLVSAVSWAAGTMLARERGIGLPSRPLMAAAMQMVAGGAVLVAASAARGEFMQIDPGAVSARSAVGLAYLIVFGSLVAFSAYAYLVKHASTALIGTYAYVNPVVAVLLGWLVLGEAVGAGTGLAGAAIVVAVALIVGARDPAPAEAQPESRPQDRVVVLRRTVQPALERRSA
jgi:drug/metabolite transporter (DMT)-like permease